MSARQYMGMLYGKLPDFFESEDELRRIGTPAIPGTSSWTA